jgi:hypothetical protein
MDNHVSAVLAKLSAVLPKLDVPIRKAAAAKAARSDLASAEK